MAVSFVAGTDLVHGQFFYDEIDEVHLPLTTALPAGLADDDTVLAFVFARATVTVPSGWTLVDATSVFEQDGAGLNPQTLRVYQKDAVASGDSSASLNWYQSDPDLRLGVFYGAFRGAGTITTDTNDASNLTTYVRTPPTMTATANGQMLVCVGSTCRTDGTSSPTFPGSFTRFSGSGLAGYRIAGAYRAVNNGESNSGDIDMAPGKTLTGGATTGLGTMTMLLEASGSSSAVAYVALDSPLGAAQLTATTRQAARLALATPIGAPALLGYHDISESVSNLSPTRWVMDLITPAGLVRAPISSWQATLQTGAAQYVGCVIPSPGSIVDDITAATDFRIYGLVTLTNGNVIEFPFAEAPLQTVALARGATNYSATISGYAPATPAVSWPPESARTLRGVRTIYTSDKIRAVCAIDWSLRPGQTAYLGEVPLVVGYITYSVSDGDQWMIVGELTGGG